MSTSPDPDIHDVFQQLYDQEDWAEDTESPSGPDLEVIETSLVTTTGPFKPYDTKRLLALMASLDSTGDAGPSRCRLFYSSTSKKTGHLASSPMPDLPPPSTYAPFSPLPLLARLRTYQPSTFSPFHPTVLSPVHLALNGWINDGRESLRCGACRAGWSVAGLLEINDLAMRTEVAKRLAQSANDRHDRSCAWRVTSSPRECSALTSVGQLSQLQLNWSIHCALCFILCQRQPSRHWPEHWSDNVCEMTLEWTTLDHWLVL